MSANRRFPLTLPGELDRPLRVFARERSISIAAAVRLLIGEGLVARRTQSSEGPASLAALVAAEHAVLMVASILPEGESRISALAERASQAAEERLAMFAEPAAPGAAS